MIGMEEVLLTYEEIGGPEAFNETEPADSFLGDDSLADVRIGGGKEEGFVLSPTIQCCDDNMRYLWMKVLCIHPFLKLIYFLVPCQGAPFCKAFQNVIGVFIIVATSWTFSMGLILIFQEHIANTTKARCKFAE